MARDPEKRRTECVGNPRWENHTCSKITVRASFQAPFASQTHGSCRQRSRKRLENNTPQEKLDLKVLQSGTRSAYAHTRTRPPAPHSSLRFSYGSPNRLRDTVGNSVRVCKIRKQSPRSANSINCIFFPFLSVYAMVLLTLHGGWRLTDESL
jgi:hypothetical protein